MADGFERGLPPNSFEVPGEVVCQNESKDVGFKDFEVGIVERFDGCFLDGPVHAFGLTIDPRVVWLGEPMLDAVLIANAVEDVACEIPPAGSIAVLRQVGKGHSIVGQHGMNGIRERLDGAAEELGAIHLAGVIAELDIGELGRPIDGQEHVELALGQAKLADIDVDVSDRGCGELAVHGSDKPSHRNAGILLSVAE